MLEQGLLFTTVAASLGSETENADKDCSPSSHSTYLSLILMQKEERSIKSIQRLSSGCSFGGARFYCAPADVPALSLSAELVGVVR
jgi:hypothetical protein